MAPGLTTKKLLAAL